MHPTTKKGNEVFIQHNRHSYNFFLKITIRIQNPPHFLMAWRFTGFKSQKWVLTNKCKNFAKN
jgi:hypothetical protein